MLYYDKYVYLLTAYLDGSIFKSVVKIREKEMKLR